MIPKQKNSKITAEHVAKDNRGKTRKQYSAEEKARIVHEALRGEDIIAYVCRREGIAEDVYYKWLKDCGAVGRRLLLGDNA